MAAMRDGANPVHLDLPVLWGRQTCDACADRREPDLLPMFA